MASIPDNPLVSRLQAMIGRHRTAAGGAPHGFGPGGAVTGAVPPSPVGELFSQLGQVDPYARIRALLAGVGGEPNGGGPMVPGVGGGLPLEHLGGLGHGNGGTSLPYDPLGALGIHNPMGNVARMAHAGDNARHHHALEAIVGAFGGGHHHEGGAHHGEHFAGIPMSPGAGPSTGPVRGYHPMGGTGLPYRPPLKRVATLAQAAGQQQHPVSPVFKAF